MRERRSTQRPAGPGLVPVLAVFASGCVVDDYIRQDGLWPAWLLAPLLLTAVLGALVVMSRRRARLDDWDLRDSAGDPGAGILVSYAISAAIICLSFPIYSFFVEAVDPTQRMYNIIFWLLGGIVGSVCGWFAGLFLSASKFEKV